MNTIFVMISLSHYSLSISVICSVTVSFMYNLFMNQKQKKNMKWIKIIKLTLVLVGCNDQLFHHQYDTISKDSSNKNIDFY